MRGMARGKSGGAHHESQAANSATWVCRHRSAPVAVTDHAWPPRSSVYDRADVFRHYGVSASVRAQSRASNSPRRTARCGGASARAGGDVTESRPRNAALASAPGDGGMKRIPGARRRAPGLTDGGVHTRRHDGYRRRRARQRELHVSRGRRERVVLGVGHRGVAAAQRLHHRARHVRQRPRAASASPRSGERPRRFLMKSFSSRHSVPFWNVYVGVVNSATRSPSQLVGSCTSRLMACAISTTSRSLVFKLLADGAAAEGHRQHVDAGDAQLVDHAGAHRTAVDVRAGSTRRSWPRRCAPRPARCRPCASRSA